MKNIDDVYRLSPMQQGMLFHSLYSPHGGAYVEQVYWTWRGPLDFALLQRAWQSVVERNPVLRTAFFWEGLAEPVQAIRTKVDLPWAQQDWRGLPPDEQEARWKALLDSDWRQGFNVSAAPLMRLTLLQLGPEHYRCLWSYHHLLLDGWSLPLCLKQVTTCYDALAQGREPELEPGRPYRDFIAWLGRRDRKEAERYWQQALQGFVAPTPLWVDRGAEQPPSVNAAYGTRSLRVPAPVTGQLTALARQHQLTPGTLVQGAWALLLARYSGERDVAFGSVSSSRSPALPGSDTMLGLLINTLATRVAVPPDAELLPWLKALQADQLAARKHDQLSLVDAQGLGQVPRGQPLFHSMVSIQAAVELKFDPLAGGKVTLDGFGYADPRTGHPLTFVASMGAELELQLVFDADRFAPDAIERMLGHVRVLLEGMASGPQRKLRELPLVTDEERHRLLVEWNDTVTEFPRDACLQHVFEAQVDRTPDAIAVEAEGARLTYRELDRRANQLAWHLRTLGVARGSIVGLCLERSAETVVGVLGILKAGGAYLPLDPAYPRDRLAFMLDESHAPVLVTQQSLADVLPRGGEQRVLMDLDRERLAASREDRPEAGTRPLDLAYVMYTSGSTGRPKGVCVPHRGVMRMAMDTGYFDTGPRETFMLFSPISFDTSAFELFGSLLHGAKLAVCPPHLHSLEELGAELTRFGVTTLWLTAPLFDQMVAYHPEALDSVRQVLAGGDVLPPGRVRERLTRGGHVINGYGPTESATFTTCYVMKDASQVERTVSIGRPIANTRVYLLDGQLQPVPQGVPGELYIGGDGLATGYLRRPALTAERFLPNPFSPEPGARMYRTGDIVRYLPDRRLEFLGRADHQVKIRGFRIELGEVEARLLEHPAVREAVALAREDVPGDRRLVAYVVLAPGAEVERGTLAGFVADRLPSHMVPSALMVLDALPLSPNGKVDRKALPAPVGAMASDTAVAGPRDAVEQQLVRIWEELLHVRPVGIDQSFFSLGGHSLLAMGMMSRIAKALGRTLPLSVLFTHPTIARLAELLREEPSSAGWSPLVPIQPHGQRRPLFCVHPIGGSALCYEPLSRHLGPEQPLYGLEAPGLDGTREPFPTLEAMAAAYLDVVLKTQPEGPYLLAGWSMGGLVVFEMARELLRRGKSVALVALIDSWVPTLQPGASPVKLDDTLVLQGFALELSQMTGHEVSLSSEELAPLSPDARRTLLFERARAANALPPGVGAETLRARLEVYRAHAQAFRGYVPASDHPASIHLLRPEAGALRAASGPLGGWDTVTRQVPRLIELPGDHYSVMVEPHVAELARQLAPLL
ncbi:amino acid adenylation domain-containing protein [Pyxidicoccus xibeiensis]|uniref:amino acid adenylation domain-containing protein n=1 Tax=Pyxidicoccus xibeiensis TaxID=2906759 RepID=UPI0020A6F35F|nr:non-ribosomal peptide synthetase [Pyxidicoccus xibeiensis]MCP3142306.1 amino acid adenylation domain-containing protein [Pyxidicoccus xibeiensis]